MRKTLARAIDSFCIDKNDPGKVQALISELADSILFAPLASEIRNDTDTASDEMLTPVAIKVVTIVENGERVIPCFSDQETFDEWSQGKYSSIRLAGSDLARSLPSETSLLLNPGTDLATALSPEQVLQLAEDSFSSGATASFAAIGDSEATHFSISSNASSIVAQTGRLKQDSVRRRIESLISGYHEVLEAYLYFSVSHGDVQAAVGLLASGLDGERRFELVQKVAEISRSEYGYVGAIEVYDDLDLKSSHSWQLFNALSPIFSREEVAPVSKSLESQMQKQIEPEESNKKINFRGAGMALINRLKLTSGAKG